MVRLLRAEHRRLRRDLVLLMTVFFTLSFMESPLYGDALRLPRFHRVLILHSYHTGYTWTDSLHETITDSLSYAYRDDGSRDNLTLEVSTEFMDTQRSFTADTFDLLAAVFRDRYTRRNISFDAIIATDDPALDFLLERRDELFGEVPVVFCGINNLDPARLAGHPLYTGVNEVVDIAGTIEMARRLRPRAERIAIVSDASITGRINTESYRAVRARFGDDVHFEELLELEPEELIPRLRALEETDAVVYLSYVTTPAGRHFSIGRSFEFITAESRAPVFSLWDFALGTGAVGGVMVSVREQGRIAAEMALRMLSGTPVGEIPLKMESPNLPMADYRALKAHAIPFAVLPADTVITGRPTISPGEYWRYILALLLFVVLQAGLIMALLSSRQRRKRAQRELMTIATNSPDLIVRLDAQGHYTFVNAAVEEITGLSSEKLVGHRYDDPEVPFMNSDQWCRTIADAMAREEPCREVFEVGTARGPIVTLEALLVPEFDQHRELASILVLSRDVTAEMQARDALAESLDEKEVLLREVHHRVKNNLQVVASLISIGANETGDISGALEEVQHRVMAMARIHEQLYQSKEFARIELQQYVEEVVYHLVAAYRTSLRGTPEISIRTAPLTIDLEIAVPFALILTELVTNAMKHAFPPAYISSSACPPSIEVEVEVGKEAEAESVVLRIRDNGVGIPDEVDFATATTTGVLLVRSLVEQLDGNLAMRRTVSHGNESTAVGVTTMGVTTMRGTTVEITFPSRSKHARVTATPV
jgi:PAS domain S-box-containing protein